MKDSKRDRSTQNPSITLQDSVDYALRLEKAFKHAPFNREDAAKQLGHAAMSGPASRKIAALVQFGLLSRAGSTYKISDLTAKISVPYSDGERSEFIKQAFLQPKLYLSLYNQFKGQMLPTALPSILVREFGIVSPTASTVTANFQKSAEFAGLLKNGVLVESKDEAPAKPLALDSDSENDATQPDGDAPGQDDQYIEGKNTPNKPSLINNSENYLPPYALENGVKVLIPLRLYDQLVGGSFAEVFAKLNEIRAGSGSGGENANKERQVD